ncbi:uncharacterized protein [Malus domestica]|uniref:uncharacterized protein isoform X2 n=2 Tax=Malus TaxID=3749 RepID=UPI0010AA3DC8|nr:uncharacterized protein LOC114819520 isoform X2 [Malus domestica]
MIKERALGDLREQSSVSNYACSAVVNNVYEELAGNPELHRPNVDVIRGSQDISPGSCLNGNFDKEKWCSTKFTPQQISTSTGSMVSGEAKG